MPPRRSQRPGASQQQLARQLARSQTDQEPWVQPASWQMVQPQDSPCVWLNTLLVCQAWTSRRVQQSSPHLPRYCTWLHAP